MTFYVNLSGGDGAPLSRCCCVGHESRQPQAINCETKSSMPTTAIKARVLDTNIQVFFELMVTNYWNTIKPAINFCFILRQFECSRVLYLFFIFGLFRSSSPPPSFHHHVASFCLFYFSFQFGGNIGRCKGGVFHCCVAVRCEW